MQIFIYKIYKNIYRKKKPQTPRLRPGWGRSPDFLFAQVTARETQGQPSADTEAETWKTGGEKTSRLPRALPLPLLSSVGLHLAAADSPLASPSLFFFPLSFSSPCVSPSVCESFSLFFSNHKTWLNAISIECRILCLYFIILSGFVHVFNCIIPLLPHFLPKTFSHII